MNFRCPACKQRIPLEDGLVVMERGAHSKRVRGNQSNKMPPVVAILCGPCTADVVLARAGLSR